MLHLSAKKAIMKIMRFILTIVPVIFFTLSCSHSENNRLIIGKWAGVEWLVDGRPSRYNEQGTHFSFNEKGEYSFEYSGTREAGTYKVENDMLFTKPGNEQEIMVKISRLVKDTLVFEMNRSGQPETLTLVRE